MPSIVPYCPILSCIVQYCPSDYFSSILSDLWYCKEHSDIVNIVNYILIFCHWLILSKTDQYCSVAPCLENFTLKLNLSHFNSYLDVVKMGYMQVCVHECMQECKFASMQMRNKKWKLGFHFLPTQSFGHGIKSESLIVI